MSVQVGIWNLDGEPVNPEFLARISRTIADFGPDGEKTYFDGSVGLLYRPFHTTTESRVEQQPHVFANGKVITWDGRLDNRNELIPQLCNDLTDDRTDVAIVASAFDRWGTACFAGLIGDWALTVWDPHVRQLILARDYIGIRHLFYYPKPKRILWCSHLNPLALCGDQFTVSDEYVAGYLAADPDAHLTPYCEIHSVPPGKFVQIRGGKTAIHTYWTFNTRLETRYKTDAEYEEHYRHLFRQSVRRRLRTDSPVLADLSGGFDSSSIVCMADDILAREGAETPRVDTFSFHDPSEPEDDDLYYLTKVETKRGKTGFHADLRIFGASVPFEYRYFVATPGFGNRSGVEAALSAVLERCEYKVELSGRGGDDVNGQGLDPRVQMADLLLQLRLVDLAKQLTAWSLLIRKRPWIHLFFQTLLRLVPVSVRARLTEQGKLEPWVKRTFARQHAMSSRQIDPLGRMLFVRPTIQSKAGTLASLSQRMSSTRPSVIEKRYPYLDQNLVEYLTSISCDQLLRPGQRRFLMRRALANLLPKEVLTRKTKAWSTRQISVALENNWNRVERYFFSDPSLISSLGYVEENDIREALLAMKNGLVPVYTLRLLRALFLELWLRDAVGRGVISMHPPVPLPVVTNFAESKAEF